MRDAADAQYKIQINETQVKMLVRMVDIALKWRNTTIHPTWRQRSV